MSHDEIATVQRPRSWPMWLFVMLALSLNISIPWLVEWFDISGYDGRIAALLFYLGVLVGESCFVVLISGLMQRTWLGAYLFGVGLACAGYGTAVIGFWLMNEFDRELISGVALVPLLLLVAACPLFALRHYFGWRLARVGESAPVRQPTHLADLFAMIAIIATALVLARVPQVVFENDAISDWAAIGISCLILFVASLIVLPLHALIVFTRIPMIAKLVWLVFHATSATGICAGVVLCASPWNARWSERLEYLRTISPLLFEFLGGAIGMFYLSLGLLYASGLRFVRHRKEATTTDDHQTALRRLTWWRIGGAIAVTMATSVYLASLERWRAVQDEENGRLRAIAQATGGELEVIDRIPWSLMLGPDATDEDLAKFSTCFELDYLTLQRSAITDNGLDNLQYFSSLGNLSLVGLPTSETGLANLKHLPNLESLSIVHCDTVGAAVRELPNKQAVASLVLNLTPFSDEQCEVLTEFRSLTTLSLAHTQVTDRCLADLGKMKTLTTIHLNATEVRTKHFPSFPVLQHLDLSETNVDDESTTSLVKLRALQYLLLRETQITNEAISSIAVMSNLYHIDLRDNAIDDEGISELSHAANLRSIDLAGTKVTGTGFTNWQPRSSNWHTTLNLNRTPIDDAGVACLKSLVEINDLSLADTATTDACLQHLAQIAIDDLDISRTAITFNGMITNGMPSVRTVHVEPGRFTRGQVSALKKQLGIEIEIADADEERGWVISH
jgi:Leucine Rich repeat